MNAEHKDIYVYDNFSSDKSELLGHLYIDVIRGSENSSFEYSDEWLKTHMKSHTLDPELGFFPGRQYSTEKNLFGVFSDASPDRWGRLLMERKERIQASQEGRKPRKLHLGDYLLGVYDETRMGGLRFKTSPEGEYLSNDEDMSVPPWTSLRSLEEASREFEKDENTLTTKWLDQLIKPGSSLGGARPKATVIDNNGNLWIAKFPSKNDDQDIGTWEKIAQDLAELCDLDVKETKLEKFSKLGSTFLIKRFDREGSKRVHFASSMTLLNKTDGASASDGTSYLDIAAIIRAYGADPKKDLVELWKRIVFSMTITNTDDHLRNHAFIYTSKGWKLSPIYDVNPVPYGDELALNVNRYDNTISLALEVASEFGLSNSNAEKEIETITLAVKSNWEKLAKKYDLSRNQIEYMRPAFMD